MAFLSVDKFDGFIYYSEDKLSGGSTGGIATGGNDNYGKGSSSGGFGGSGSIWSSCEQVIWVSCGGLRYPIYLKPGWNDVWFWIPNIFPDDTWVESQIVIESDGYILIPAGFEWTIITGEDAPYYPSNQKMAEKLQFKDCYSIEIYTKPVPVDLDNIIDKLGFGDVSLTEIKSLAVKTITQLEDIGFEDIHKLELEISVPEDDVEITEGEIDITDNTMIIDLVNTDTINITITDNQNGVEATGFSDIIDIEI